jgi:hypothetical protein
MNTYRTGEPRQRSEVELYYDACEALDNAKRETPHDTELIARLNYKVNVALDKAHAALSERDKSVDENIANLFREIKGINDAMVESFNLTIRA